MKKDNPIINEIKRNNDKFIKDDLIPFLQIPSVTKNKDGINEAIEFIKSYISQFSDEFIQFQGKINPLILSKVKGNTDRSLLIYMMYDTQPVKDLENWIAPPFEAKSKTLPTLPELGECIIARGAYNSKTPLLSFLNTLKILKDNDDLPFSLYLIIDGEEEMGSPSFPKFLKKYEKSFINCNDAYYPALKQDIDGIAVLKLGYKGILSLKIDMFTNNEEVHSSYSNVIPNPAIDLVKLINFLYFNEKISIPSLSKNYEFKTEDEKLIEVLINKKNIEKIKKKAGIKQIIIQDSKDFFIKYLFDPTFNISTLKSGYINDGIKNSVPNFSTCNIDIRFAHEIPINTVFNELKEKIDDFSDNISSNIKIYKNVGYESSKISEDSVIVRSLINSFKEMNVSTELWPISAASSPLNILQNQLGISYITGGLGIAGNAHTTNEFVQLDSIINARLGYYYFFKKYQENYKTDK